MKPNSIFWGVLLTDMVVKRILELEPKSGVVYVLLCNIYAACKRWNDLRELRHMEMDKGIKKTPLHFDRDE